MSLVITLRVDSVTPTRISFTIFENGGNVGRLCMTRRGFDIFALRFGAYPAMEYVAKTLKKMQEVTSER